MTERRYNDEGIPLDYTISAYNAEGDNLSLRPEHLADYEALCRDAWEVGPFTAGDALAYVREAGRVGVRANDDSELLVQPVARYRLWYAYAPGHFEDFDAPRTSAHSVCLHPATKAARAACRRAGTA